jgi:putative nucleotidyltransferase with HDIG domain
MPRQAARGARVREAWDAPSRSEAQERFYRELMAVDKLPSAPEVAQRLLLAVNREDSHIDQLAALIGRDQSLTARLLALANSAFFSTRVRVTTIPQATTLLGFSRVRDLALGLSVWSTLGGKSPAARRWRKTLWGHSSMVASTAKMLVERTGGDGGEAFAAGLLHDIGKLALGIRLGETYWALLEEAANEGQPVATLEMDVFGCHHATVGGWLLQLWRLPTALVDAVAAHHDPLVPDYGLDLPAIVATADRLVSATDTDTGVDSAAVLDELRNFAPGLLTPESWRELYAGLAKEQHAVGGMFD